MAARAAQLTPEALDRASLTHTLETSMGETTSKLAYVIGILLGIPALIVALRTTPSGGGVVTTLAQTSAVFLLFGGLAGLFAPAGRWRGGVAVAFPLVLLVLLSVAFAGHLRAFLVHDAPVLAAALVFGAVGGLLGAMVRSRKARAV